MTVYAVATLDNHSRALWLRVVWAFFLLSCRSKFGMFSCDGLDPVLPAFYYFHFDDVTMPFPPGLTPPGGLDCPTRIVDNKHSIMCVWVAYHWKKICLQRGKHPKQRKNDVFDCPLTWIVFACQPIYKSSHSACQNCTYFAIKGV